MSLNFLAESTYQSRNLETSEELCSGYTSHTKPLTMAEQTDKDVDMQDAAAGAEPTNSVNGDGFREKQRLRLVCDS